LEQKEQRLMGKLPPIRVEIEEGTVRVLARYVSPYGIVIDEGFECDGQSWFIGEKRAMAGGVLHDHLYRLAGLIPDPTTDKIYSREAADELFLQALKDSGVNFLSRWTRYLTLRLVGRKAWNDHKRRIEDEKKSNLTQPHTASV
jgi:hypothetical protein